MSLLDATKERNEDVDHSDPLSKNFWCLVDIAQPGKARSMPIHGRLVRRKAWDEVKAEQNLQIAEVA